MIAKKLYSVEEFNKLRYITETAVAQHKPILTRDAEASWYVVYDTPDGKYITAKLWDHSGIGQVKVFAWQFKDHDLRLAPDPEPERRTRWFNVYKDGPNFFPNFGKGYETKEEAKSNANYPCFGQVEVTVEKQPDGKWVVVGAGKTDRIKR